MVFILGDASDCDCSREIPGRRANRVATIIPEWVMEFKGSQIVGVRVVREYFCSLKQLVNHKY